MPMGNEGKSRKTRYKEAKGNQHMDVLLSHEESRMLVKIQEAWRLPSKTETFRWMLKDCHERTTTQEHQTILDMFGGVQGAMESLLADQSQFRTDLTRDVMRLVERAGNSADRITLVTEAATEKIGSRVENSIAITRQMEIDLKEQLGAANKMLWATLLRMSIEQGYLPVEIQETIKEGLTRAGLGGV